MTSPMILPRFCAHRPRGSSLPSSSPSGGARHPLQGASPPHSTPYLAALMASVRGVTGGPRGDTKGPEGETGGRGGDESPQDILEEHMSRVWEIGGALGPANAWEVGGDQQGPRPPFSVTSYRPACSGVTVGRGVTVGSSRGGTAACPAGGPTDLQCHSTALSGLLDMARLAGWRPGAPSVDLPSMTAPLTPAADNATRSGAKHTDDRRLFSCSSERHIRWSWSDDVIASQSPPSPTLYCRPISASPTARDALSVPRGSVPLRDSSPSQRDHISGSGHVEGHISGSDQGEGRDPADGCTIVGYYFCDEPIPYRTFLIGQRPTLRQFKKLIGRQGHFRYFFRRASDEFSCGGVVLEELTRDDDSLPLWEGKVIGKVELVVQ